MDASRRLTDEDVRICELVQANLQRGVYTRGPLSPRHENGVWAFHSWLQQARDQALPLAQPQTHPTPQHADAQSNMHALCQPPAALPLTTAAPMPAPADVGERDMQPLASA